MRYEGSVYRPPSEANSFILQATIGCSHNACTFCGMYKDKKFRIRSREEIETDIRLAKLYYGDVEKVFLADGDALAMETSDLVWVLEYLYRTFPALRHVGIYASPQSILNKTPEELQELRAKGLTIAYLGIETGDPQLLKEIHKGVNEKEMIAAGHAVIEAGIELSCTVILGLAGNNPEKSQQHAVLTAEVAGKISPHYLAALTLMIVPQTVLYNRVRRGEFVLPGPFEILQELKIMLENLSVQRPCIFRSNHASNYLPIRGTLPQDKEAILNILEKILSERRAQYLRPEFMRGL